MAERVEHTSPEPGVTEIRVHGVGGANPSATLGRTDVQQVTGDATAGFFRAANPTHANRTVEAYSWGGLTARGRSRAMWVLLLPFALVNLAGWMVEPIPSRQARPDDPWLVKAIIWAANNLEKAQRSLVHGASLALTGAYVMWVALMSMNLLAYQCGTLAACAEGRFYSEFLQGSFFVGQPGRRIVIGALVPLALLALIGLISVVSRARYESYTEARSGELNPPGEEEAAESPDVDEEHAKPHILSTAMDDVGFWYTTRWHSRLFRAHVAFALALLSGVTSYASWQLLANVPEAAATAGPVKGLAIAAFAAAVGLAIAVVTFVTYSVWKEDRSHAKYESRLETASTGLLWTGFALTAAALLIAWQLKAPDSAVLGDATTKPDLWGFGWTPVVLFAAAVLAVLFFSLVEIAKWTVTCQIDPALFFIAIAGVMILAWPYAWIVFLIAAAIAIPARYIELKLCKPGSPSSKTAREETTGRFSSINEWVEVGAATAGLLVIQQIGSRVWPDTVWGDEWPRLTPVLLTSAVNLFFFYRYTKELAKKDVMLDEDPSRYGTKALIFPGIAAAVLLAAGVVGWLLLDRIDAVYLAAYTAWMVISFFWVAIKPHDGFRWNGPGAVALLAVSLTAGLFSGGLIRFVSLLTREGYELQTIELYGWLAVGFVAIFSGGLVAFVTWLLFSRATHGEYAKRKVLNELEKLKAEGAKPAPATIAGKVRNWTSLARGVEAVDVFIMHISMVTLFATMALVLHFFREGVPVGKFLDEPLGDSWGALVSTSAWVTLMIVLGAVLAVRSGLRNEGFRRQIGIIWDVTSFWPRHFHPFAPPSYAVRTVPELQQRLTEITDTGAAVLSGHSQGSVVAFATAASIDKDVANRIAIVTHGSPLRRFYARFFPSYFEHELINATAARVGPTDRVTDGSWLNFYRPTDPIGQPIFVDELEPDEIEPLAAIASTLSPSGITRLPDVALSDPPDLKWQQHQGPPDVLWHINYMSDPLMAKAIDTLTDVLGSEPEEN